MIVKGKMLYALDCFYLKQVILLEKLTFHPSVLNLQTYLINYIPLWRKMVASLLKGDRVKCNKHVLP